MTSRVRCSCGRIYDPVKHNTCPDCGAESAVESVVVAEKVKPPAPPEVPAEKRITVQPRPIEFGRLLKSLPWPVYAAGAAFVLIVLMIVLRHRGPSASQGTADTGRQVAPPEQKSSPSEIPSGGATAPPGAPAFSPGATIPSMAIGNLSEMIAKAGPNGTVKLSPGLYQGGATVTQPVKIIGDNASQVFIQSDTRDAIAVRSKGVVLQNMQIMFNGTGEMAALTVGDNAELETDGVKVMSSSSYGLSVTGNGSIKATASTFSVTSGTAAQIDRQSRANFTKCSFTDAQTGLMVGSASTAELNSCAFERNGARTSRGAIMAISGDKTQVTAEGCRFASNPSGIIVGEGGSLLISNSQFKDNGTSSVQGNSAPGLIQVRSAGQAKLQNDTFETNAQGVVATNGGIVEVEKCRFDGTGLQTRGELIPSCAAICGNGQGTTVTVRNSTIAGSVSYSMAIMWSARLNMEETEISGAKTVGLLVGDRNGLPANAEVKHCKFVRNTTGIGVCAGSSVNVVDSESRENSEGVIALDKSTRVVLTKATLIGNREHGLCVYGGAEAEATDSIIENNGRGAQSGMQHKSSMSGASLVLQNTHVAGNQIFGVGAYSKNTLTLTGVTFDGNGKTNIYKESGATVHTDGAVDPSQAQASNDDNNSAGNESSSKQRVRKKQQQQQGMTDEDAHRIIRRFFRSR